MGRRLFALFCLIVLSVLSFSGCADTLEGKYLIILENTRQYSTDNYTISDQILTMHGYWDSGQYSFEDYVLNMVDVETIREGSTQLYPTQAETHSIWEWIRYGNTMFMLPIWLLFSIALFIFMSVIYNSRGMLRPLYDWLKTRRLHSVMIHPECIAQQITIPPTTQGIIATRDWKLLHGRILSSANQGLIWQDKETVADQKPVSKNIKGIYAYRLGTNMKRKWGVISGIVSMSGHCVGHADGRIRAEKCEILMLFCLWPNTAKKLSETYGVPVMLTLDKRSDLEQWLISPEGIRWLQHNNGELGNSQIEKTIEDILQKEEFQ